MGIYQRGDSPYWWYKIKIKGKKPIYGSTQTIDKKLALDIANVERTKLLRGEYFNAVSNIAADTLFDQYLKACRTQRSYETKRIQLQHVRSYFKGKRAAEITPEDVHAYQLYREDFVKRSTINRELGPARNAYNRAIHGRQHNLTKNPFSSSRYGAVKFYNEKKFRRDRMLLHDEKMRLLPVLSEIGHYGQLLFKIVVFGLQTGMRQGEIRDLKWEDVNFATGKIRVVAGDEDNNRYVPIFYEAMLILRSLPNWGEYVFCHEDGKRLSRYGFISSSFKAACRRARIKNFRFHDLRHTFISELLMAGADLKTVGEYVGHSLVTMTERYSHITEEHRAAQIKLLPSAFSYVQVTSQTWNMPELTKLIDNQVNAQVVERQTR